MLPYYHLHTQLEGTFGRVVQPSSVSPVATCLIALQFLPVRRYASAVLAVTVCLSVHPFVFLFLANRYSAKMAKPWLASTMGCWQSNMR